jgi:hypothetical protein
MLNLVFPREREHAEHARSAALRRTTNDGLFALLLSKKQARRLGVRESRTMSMYMASGGNAEGH